ncbi:MAG: primosomal protein N' [Parcubacteria group bacterium]
MKNSDKYIISVVPLTRIPLYRDQFFYYSYSRKIPKGSLAEIPLGKRKIEGIVINSKKDFPRLGNIKLKKISRIVEEKLLTEEQLHLAQFISDYYIVSLGIVMKSFVPRRVRARIKNKESGIKNYGDENIELTKEQKIAIDEITKKVSRYAIRDTRFMLFGPSSSGKTQVYFEAIKKIINLKNPPLEKGESKGDSKSARYIISQSSQKNFKSLSSSPFSKGRERDGQALVLLPELTITSQEIERYGDFFGYENIAVLHSKISKGKFYENWRKIKSGEAKIILGTRQAVFAPFKNLKIIVVDEEQDISHKQWDMNPRYDARTAAEKLAEIFEAKLVLGSATPRIETYFKSNKQHGTRGKKDPGYKLLKLSKLPLSRVPCHMSQIEIVDLRKEHWHNFKKIKNVSPISKKLEAEITWTLKNKMQIILFINRQGMSRFTVCDNCGKVLKCPDCERSLTYKSKGNYECIHCKFETGDFPLCPKCQGMAFKNIGLGTEKIESEIEKMFPSARIARADSSSIRKSTRFQEKLWKDFSQGKIDILVGTQMIAKAWDIGNVGLVGIIDADSLFSFPDFRTNENAFSLILQVIGRTGRVKSKFPGKAIIQTYHPENQIIRWASERNYEKFYEAEIKERKNLSYPPFSKLIKLTFQDHSRSKTEKEADTIYKKLEEGNKSKSAQIYPPQEPLGKKLRGRYRRQIIIKIKKGKSFHEELRKILERLGNGWMIDADPASLI